MAKTAQPPASPGNDNLTIYVRPGDDPAKVSAKVLTGPHVTSASTILKFGKGTVGELNVNNVVAALTDRANAVKANNLGEVEELLTSQATALNMIFAELSRRAALNMGEYLDAAQRYMNMALKAQNQSRMTLETLSAIKNPPVVYAKQANIANGPQQVNNGTMQPSRAAETEIKPNKLLGPSHEQPMDTATPGTAGGSDKAMAPVGKIDGAANR